MSAGEIVQSEIPPGERRLLAAVEPRIARFMWIIGTAGTAALWSLRGAGWGLGFAAGALLSGLNFRWMKAGVNAIAQTAPADPTGAAPSKPRGMGGAAARFVLRYALIGAAGYAIFRSPALSLVAFFTGLFVAIAAIMAEVFCQVYDGFRRGT